MNQEPISFTPVSNLTYIASPKPIFHVCQIVPWEPLMPKNVPQK